jgi:hypothetical protein
MKKALMVLPFLLFGCGGIKNTNPLLGLGGPQDNSRYSFESSTMGWIPEPEPSTAVDSVFQSTQVSFFGSGSLGLHVTEMSSTNAGFVGVPLSPVVNFTGKNVTLWIYMPAAAAPSSSEPTQAQIFMKDNLSDYANSAGVNLVSNGWTQMQWSPLSNASSSSTTIAGAYYAGNFNAAAVGILGVKFACAGDSGSFTYTGQLFIDSVNW